MIFWQMAWRNLVLHRRRSIITGIAIALGFTAVVLLGGYMMRMENYLKTQGVYLSHVGHISIYKKNGLQKHLNDPDIYSLSIEDQENILGVLRAQKNSPEFVTRNLHGQGLITNGCRSYPFFMTAVEPQAEAWARSHPEPKKWTPDLLGLVKGSGFWNPSSSPDHIVVAYRLAKLLHKSVISGDTGENTAAADQIFTDCSSKESWDSLQSHSGVQLVGSSFSGGLAAADARISGHYTTGMAMSDDGSILVPLTLAQNFFGTDKVTWISVFLRGNESASLAAKRLRKAFEKNGWQYDVYTYGDAEVNPFYVGAMNFVYVMMAFFLVLVCGVVALSILNSLQISLLERKTELGTLRAVGFRQNIVAHLFVREVVLLTTVSLAIGCALALLISAIINSLNLRFPLVGTADEIEFLLKPTFSLTMITALVFLAVSALTCYFECTRRLKSRVVSLLEVA